MNPETINEMLDGRPVCRPSNAVGGIVSDGGFCVAAIFDGCGTLITLRLVPSDPPTFAVYSGDGENLVKLYAGTRSECVAAFCELSK